MTDAVRLSKTSRPGKMSALRPPGMVFFPARAQGKLRGIFPQLRMAAMTLPPIAPLRGLKHWLYKLFLCGRSRQWPGSGDFSRNENERGSPFPCVLSTAVGYCCGAVARRVTAALLGRFLPKLGPLASAGGPFSWHVLGAFLARAIRLPRGTDATPGAQWRQAPLRAFQGRSRGDRTRPSARIGAHPYRGRG